MPTRVPARRAFSAMFAASSVAATRPSRFLYGQLRFAQRIPVVIAIAELLIVGTVLLTIVALRLRS